MSWRIRCAVSSITPVPYVAFIYQSQTGRLVRLVIAADLSGYFDPIPRPELMKCLARCISDGALLRLVKSWLEMPIEEEDDKGGNRRSNPGRREKRGTPQGAPISPLLSNVYMRRFLLGWKLRGYGRKLKAPIVNDAADLVILCGANAEPAARLMRSMMRPLRGTVNEEKTTSKHLPEKALDFLGYPIGGCYSIRTGKGSIGPYPSKEKLQPFTHRLNEMLRGHTLWRPESAWVGDLNRRLRGWGNHFSPGAVSKADRAVDAPTRKRLRQWVRDKQTVHGAGTRKVSDEYR